MTQCGKKLFIKQCPDGHRWYAALVGQTVPYLGDVGDEYKSCEPAGYVNFVQYADADIVDNNDHHKINGKHEK